MAKKKPLVKRVRPRAKKQIKGRKPPSAEQRAGMRYRSKHRLLNFYVTPKVKAKVLASAKKLTGGNRAAWFRRMVSAIRA